VLQCVALCCSVLQGVALCCTVLHCVVVCCGVAVCCSVLQFVAVCWMRHVTHTCLVRSTHHHPTHLHKCLCVTVRSIVLHCIAVCYSVLQCAE